MRPFVTHQARSSIPGNFSGLTKILLEHRSFHLGRKNSQKIIEPAIASRFTPFLGVTKTSKMNVVDPGSLDGFAKGILGEPFAAGNRSLTNIYQGLYFSRLKSGQEVFQGRRLITDSRKCLHVLTSA